MRRVEKFINYHSIFIFRASRFSQICIFSPILLSHRRLSTVYYSISGIHHQHHHNAKRLLNRTIRVAMQTSSGKDFFQLIAKENE
jgi:hypothetical protein